MKRLFIFTGSLTAALAVFIAACTKTSQDSIKPMTSDKNKKASLTATPTYSTVTLPAIPFVTGYVEVNNNDLLNTTCYTYNSGKQLFTIANIFAANINNDGSGTPGNAVLYFNQQVASVLNSGQIAALHSKGVKVLLDILGNHQNAGWSCFNTYAQADAFALKVRDSLNKYNLDGIDIDDEYSACSSSYNTSLVIALTALRAELGTSKLITTTAYSATPIGDFTATYNGLTAVSFLDFLIEDSYFNTNYASRMQYFVNAGFAKNRLFVGYHLDYINDQVALSTFVKNNGYAGVMAYGVANGTGTQLSQLSGISNTLFGATSNLTNACLNPITNITTGFNYQVSSAIDTTYVLNVATGGSGNGSFVQLYKINNTSSQRWNMMSLGSGYYTLWSGAYPSSVMDDYLSGTASGNQVDIWTSNNTNAQKWLLTSAGGSSYTLSPACAPLTRLDDNQSIMANGNKIQIWTANGTKAQTWVFTQKN